MKVLIVCSGNHKVLSPFIKEQADSLMNYDIEINFYIIKGKGMSGYLKNFPRLKRKISSYKPDIIHAHYGLSGFLAVLQRKVPVVITYHGSDIYNKIPRFFSILATKLSAQNIFVSKEIAKISRTKEFYVIPCGIDLRIFSETNRSEARKSMNLDFDKKYILFSSSFHNLVKNYTLAKKAIQFFNNPDLILLELNGYSRKEVSLLLNVADLALVTSFTEGSPQFIKEAMACNCPIVSTNVGDVKEVIGNVNGCYICSYEPSDVSVKIKQAILFGKRTEGRKKIIEGKMDSDSVAKAIIEIYKKTLK